MTKQEFEKGIKRVLIPQTEIQEKIQAVGAQITKEYEGKPLLLVSILNGAFVFMADLCRAIRIPCETAFMCAKSDYNGTTSSGIVKITMDLAQDISNYHVIIAEDIIDTGRTLNDVVKLLQARNPLSLKVITLLDKPDRRLVDLKADISLFTIPDVFVVDPPRKGCDDACLNTMLRMQPERIVYVSCDSATLARDLKILCDGGYEIRKLRGVDQFGMTVHVECVIMMQYCGKEKK